MTVPNEKDQAFSQRQHILLWLACSAIFFEAFDVSVVNLALPVMATSLQISLASAQWIQTIYLLSFGGCLLLGGRLCDYAGSRRIFLTGMAVFGGASALALVSSHVSWLLLARSGQGVGAALAMPAGISLLARYFKEGLQRQKALSIFGAFAAIGFAGGLALGGTIAAWFDWHWIFGVNVPVIAGVLMAAYSYIPKEERKNTTPLNLPTVCWLTATLLLFCFGVHEGSRIGWWSIPCLVGALVSGTCLIRFDRRQEQPFFQIPIMTGALGASFLLGACFLSFVFLCTLSLYELMHWNIRTTGLLLFPYSIGSALVSQFGLPRLFRRMRVAQVGRLAMICLLGGVLLLMAGICTHQLPWFLVALFLVNSCCIAIGYPAFTILSLSGVPPAQQGMAAGLQSATYSVGTGVGISAVGCCLSSFTSGQDARYALCLAGGVIAAGCVAALILLTGGRN